MRRNQSGQSLVELGVVVTLFITLTLGAVEFGYAFMALHIITHASSVGARYASALDVVGSRGTCGVITAAGQSQVQGRVTSQIGGVVNVTNVAVTQTPTPAAATPCPTITEIPTVTVTVTGSIPHLFGLLGSGALSFTRAQTFRDEGR